MDEEKQVELTFASSIPERRRIATRAFRHYSAFTLKFESKRSKFEVEDSFIAIEFPNWNI